MNTTTTNRRPLVALIAAAALGGAIGFGATTAFAAPPRAALDAPSPPECSEERTSEPDPQVAATHEYAMPPSDFLRGAGRLAPVAH